MDFHSTEIHLGSENWQDYISKGYVTYRNILYSSEICAATGLEVGNMDLHYEVQGDLDYIWEVVTYLYALNKWADI